MEIAGADGGLRDLEGRDLLGFDVNDTVLILQLAGEGKNKHHFHNPVLTSILTFLWLANIILES